MKLVINSPIFEGILSSIFRDNLTPLLFMCVKSNYLKLFQSLISAMDDLFTFSSEQFQMVVPQPSNTQSIRKRIISNIGIKRQSSIQSDSTTCQRRQSKKGLKSCFKKVEFDLTPLPQLRKHSSEVDNYLEENLQKLEKPVQTKSRRYLGQIQNKKSLQLQRKSSFAGNIIQEHGNSSVEAEQILRKERRIKSLRLAPKIIIPLSDRKLPKVFKVMHAENYLPALLCEKEGKKRLVESREIRQTLSSQRARVLLNYEQLCMIGKRQFLEDDGYQTPQKI